MHQLWLSVTQKKYFASCLLLTATVETLRAKDWVISVQLSCVSIFTTVARSWKYKAANVTECNSFRFILWCVYRSVWGTTAWSSTEMSPESPEIASSHQLTCTVAVALFCWGWRAVLVFWGHSGSFLLHSPTYDESFGFMGSIGFFTEVLILDPTGRESESSQFGPGTYLWGPAIIT